MTQKVALDSFWNVSGLTTPLQSNTEIIIIIIIF